MQCIDNILTSIKPFISNLNKTEIILLTWTLCHIILISIYLFFLIFTGLCIIMTPICLLSTIPFGILSFIRHIVLGIIFSIILIISFFYKYKISVMTIKKKIL